MLVIDRSFFLTSFPPPTAKWITVNSANRVETCFQFQWMCNTKFYCVSILTKIHHKSDCTNGNTVYIAYLKSISEELLDFRFSWYLLWSVV